MKFVSDRTLEERKQLLLKRAKYLNFSKTGNNLLVVDEINHREFFDTVYTLDQMLVRDQSIRFVIIDTLQLFLDWANLIKIEMAVNYLQALKDVAYERQVSILLAHYSNKNGINESMDSIARSLGRKEFIAFCDTMIFLTKIRNERRADMFITGSETMDRVYTLKMDDFCGWVLEGEKREVVEGDTQKLIAVWIKENGGGRPIDIFKGLKAEGYKGTADTIRKTCQRMKQSGKLTNFCGKYILCIPSKHTVMSTPLLQLEFKGGGTFTPPVTPVTVSQSESEGGGSFLPPVPPVTVSQSENEMNEPLPVFT